MTLLTGIRNLMSRRKLETPDPLDEPPKVAQEVEIVGVLGAAGAGSGTDVARRVLEALDERLEAQAAQTRSVAVEVEQLAGQHFPQVVDKLNDIERACGQVLDLLRKDLEQTRSREEVVETAAQRMTDFSAHDAEALDALRRQLEANTQAIRGIGESYEALSLGLREDLSSRLQEVVADLGLAGEERETNLVEMLGRARRWMLLLTVGCSAAALMALILSIVALLT